MFKSRHYYLPGLELYAVFKSVRLELLTSILVKVKFPHCGGNSLVPHHTGSAVMIIQLWTFFAVNIIQLFIGDEGNIWYVGPEDKMLPEVGGREKLFVWTSNISYVAWIPRQ